MSVQRATVKGRISGIVETRNVFTADVTIIAGDDYADYWFPYLDSIFDALAPLISNIWAEYEAEITIPAGGRWEPVTTFPLGGVGSATGEPLPNAVAAVLLGKAAGIRHTGRKFISPLPESLVAGNLLVGAGITAAAAGLLAYVTPLDTILGSHLAPGVVDSLGNFHPFVSGIVSSVLGSVRKRKPGLGI